MKNIITTVVATLLVIGGMAQSYTTQVKPDGSKLWGYANQSGEMTIPAKYRTCYYFSEGFAAVYESKKYFFIKSDGSLLNTEVKSFRLARSSAFGYQGFWDGMVQVKVDEKWGYLNTEGDLAIEAKYDVASRFDNGFATVKKGTEFYIIDKEGNEVKVDVAGIKSLKHFTEGIAAFKRLDGKNGYINSVGKVVIEPIFIGIGYFKDGVAWAKNEYKQLGYINKKGKWVIEPIFMAGKNFDKTSGLARVKHKEQWAYVAMDGEIMYMKDTDIWGDFYDGLAKGRKHGKLGFFDKTGTYAIEPQFEGVRDFRNGFAAAKLNGKWGMINTSGEWVIQPKFIGIKDMELMP